MTNKQNYKTPQEEFWAGDFGKDYIERNVSPELLASNLVFFAKALNRAENVNTCLEFGANVGMNLKALKLLFPKIELNAIEISQDAVNLLGECVEREKIFQGSIFDYPVNKKVDLVLMKTVLIHINPEMLNLVYEKMYQASSHYILVCEYYNTTPVAIPYRGHIDRLFKRDFAGEMLDKYSDLSLIDNGFAYHRIPPYMNDDITWFLMEKKRQ